MKRNIIYGSRKISDNEELYLQVKMDEQGKYSLSHYDDAMLTAYLIKNKYGDISILDGTAGAGGNSISFGIIFSNVKTIEMDTERFKLLSYNIKELFKLDNILINDDFYNHINDDYNLLFLDPPWGGPDYKYKNMLRLTISNKTMKDIANFILSKNRKLVLKLPFNYDLTEFNGIFYEKYKIKNYLLILIKNKRK